MDRTTPGAATQAQHDGIDQVAELVRAVTHSPRSATLFGVLSTQKMSDPELVDAVRRGGAREFAELYRAHVSTVRCVVAGLIRDDPETVADVVQETFLRALHSLNTLQDGSRLRAWLTTIARNLATDHLRARQRVTVLDEPHALDLADTSPGPAHSAEISDLALRVEGCVAGLSQRDATAIALVTHFGFGATEVAGALGLSVGAAKVVLHRARRRLRQALVLQVMVGQPELACPELRRILAEDPSAAARHVQRCGQCISSAASQVVPLGPPRVVTTLAARVSGPVADLTIGPAIATKAPVPTRPGSTASVAQPDHSDSPLPQSLGECLR